MLKSMAQRKPGPMIPHRPPNRDKSKSHDLELGRDGISSMVDQDRALRAREVFGSAEHPLQTYRTLRERITGTPARD
jgi:hypothetical protein